MPESCLYVSYAFRVDERDCSSILKIRIYLMRAGPSLDGIDRWNEVKPLINYGENERLNVRSVKLFMDGVV